MPRAPAADHRLVERCAAASVVLIGGAIHGTHEFHALRAQVTRRLVEDHGFHAVAIEELTQLPPWVWRNRVVQSFVDWLHERNGSVPSGVPSTAFVGLDPYEVVDGEQCNGSEAVTTRGTCATSTWRRHWVRSATIWPHRSRPRASSSGPTTHMSVTPGPPRWGAVARTRSASCSGRATPARWCPSGMTTHTGMVTAAHGLGGRQHRMRVLEAILGSYEELFHAVGRDRF